MSKGKNKKEETIMENNEVENEVASDPQLSTADKVINDAFGKYDSVMVIGIDKATKLLNIQSSFPSFPAMHYMLNKALFEMNVFEMNSGKKDQQAN